MGEFPWQKDGHRDEALRWDRRMPWQQDGGDESAPKRDDGPATSGRGVESTDDGQPADAPRADEAAFEDVPVVEEGDVTDLPVEEPGTEDPADEQQVVGPADADPVADAATEPTMPWQRAAAEETPTVAPPTSEPPPIADPGPVPAAPSRGGKAPLRPAVPYGAPRPPRSAVAAAKKRFGIVPWVVIGVVALPVLFGVFGPMFDDLGDDGAASEADQEDMARIAGEFFSAVADGDLDEALARLDVDAEADGDYQSHALLTQEVLDAISERAPLSDVSVGDVSPDPEYDWRATVEVGYRLGDGPHTVYEIEIEESSWADEEWAVTPGNFSQWLSPETLPEEFEIEGVAIDEENRYVLLPGLYAFDTGSELTTLWAYDEASDPVLFEDRLLPIPGQWESLAGTELTAEGREQVVAAIDASLEACVDEDTLETACGSLDEDAFGGADPVDGTLRREITFDSGVDDVVSLAYDDPTRADSYRYIEIGVTARCADGDAEVECSADEYLEQAVVDISDPEFPVRWEHGTY